MKFAKRIKSVAPSATLAITARAKELKAKGADVVNFAAGEPDFDTPDYIKNEAVLSIKAGFTKYTPTQGMPELKSAICDKLLADNKLSYKPSQIVVSCGAKHSLYNTLQVLCDEGDEVIVASPYWVSYPEMVRLAGGTPRFIQTCSRDNFIPTQKALKEAVTKKTRGIILNSPTNPTGAVYRKDDLSAVAEISARHDLFIISDEIYEKIIYEGARHISAASLSEDAYRRTIVVNGVSKTYSMTGWRIGYLAASPEVAEAVGRLQDHSTSNPASISQKAALAALKGNGSFIEKMASEFKLRRDYLFEGLDKIEGFSPFKPQGAFYIFCDISGLAMQANDVAARLLDEEAVAVIPCESFGSAAHIRLSFATGMGEIKKGLDRIAKWAQRLQRRS